MWRNEVTDVTVVSGPEIKKTILVNIVYKSLGQSTYVTFLMTGSFDVSTRSERDLVTR